MPLISNKREFLARRMRDVGLLRLIERAARRPSLLVLTYHRIEDQAASPYYAPISSATAETFERQVRTLRDTHRVVTSAELAALADSGFRVTEPTAMVTFDDGYLDNVRLALPILLRLGVPATFFLTTGFLDRPSLPWWDHVAYVINRTTVPTLRLDRPEPLTIELGPGPRTSAVARVIRAWLDHRVDDDPAHLAHLEERAGFSADAESLGRALFMTWDQARGLIASGMAVGSHATTHRNLGRMSIDDQRDELAGSKRRLEAELGVDVTTLAYPYGWPGAFNESTLRLAREAGYRAAFSSVEGVNRPGKTDPYAVRRLGVGFADSPVMIRARLALLAAVGRSPV